MKKIFTIVLCLLALNSVFGQVSVTGCTGAGNGSYSTLSAAVSAIVAAQPGAVILISITGNTTEPVGGATLVAGTWTSLTIQPSGGAWTVNGAITAGNPLLTLNGSDNVTIDGLNTGGNALTISNTNTSATLGTSTIKFINDASNNFINNCSVLGSATMANFGDGGTIFFGTGSTTGNDNNTIVNVIIGPAGSNLPGKGIYSLGSTASAAIANSNNTVNNCQIFDFFSGTEGAGIALYAGNTDWTITNNKIYETAARTFTAAGSLYGIYVNSPTYGNNFQITGNTIGFANASGTGTLTLGPATIACGFQGIALYAMPTAANACNINNNTVSNISLTSSTGSFLGINNATAASSNTININNNTVSNITLVSTTGTFNGINYGGASIMTVSGNIIHDITRNAAGGTNSFSGIFSVASCDEETISNNNVYNLSNTSTTTTSGITGIYQNTAVGTKIFQNNMVHDITGTYGNNISGLSINTGTTVIISGNIVYNLSSSGGTASNIIYGIILGANPGSIDAYMNKIYNLGSSTASPSVWGIYVASGAATTRNIYNNLIGNLTASAANTADAIRGLYIIAAGTTANINVFYNTVYLNATSSGTNFGSSGIYHTVSTTSSTAKLDLRNNIIVNTSTANGTGFTVAYRRSSGAANTLANYGNTSNNNLFYAGSPGSSNLIYYDGTSSAQTLAAYKAGVFTAGTIAPRDAASVTEMPNFLSTTGSDINFLHISTSISTQVESGGAAAPGISTDFDGDTRNIVTPDIGADEFAGIPYSCITPSTYTVTGGGSICSGGTGIPVGLNGSQLGVTYQLYIGASPVGAIVSGTGSTISFGNQTVAGTYTVQTTLAGGYCSIPMTGSAVVVVTPSPSVTSAATGNICSGVAQSYNITSGVAGTTYNWSRTAVSGISNPAVSNQTSNPITEVLNNTSVVPVVVTYQIIPSANGCIGSTFTYTVTVNITPTAPMVGTITQPTCTLGTGSVILNGLPATGTWTLTRTPGGAIYSGTGTTKTISNLAPGTYTFTLTNAGGCTSPSSANVVINSQPAPPPTPVVTQNGNILHSDATAGNQWYNQTTGLISGAVNQDYTITANGDYYVIVTLNGCISDTSNLVHVTNYGIENNWLQSKISVYPNPANDKLFANFSEINEIPQGMKMFNTIGQIVFETLEPLIINLSGLDVSQLNPGAYTLQIMFDKGIVNKSVIVK